MNIADAPVGSVFDGPVLIEKFETGKTKRDTLFATMTVKDEFFISARAVMWNYNTSDAPYLQAGNVIDLIAARVGEYNGRKQLVIEGYTPSNKDPMDFVKKTDNITEKLALVSSTINTFKDQDLRKLGDELLYEPDGMLNRFAKAPAATGVHNNWVGGLLEHVCSMITLAKPIIEFYKERYAPYLNEDYVLFGIIFHDLGKVIEYELDNPAFEKTPQGHLVNHLVIGPAWIYHACKKLGINSKTTAELMHVVAAHHGCNEWGSPVKPVMLEAILLHHIDNMDSKFMHAWDMMENTDECQKGLTKRSWVEGTRFISQKENYYAKATREPHCAGNGLTPKEGPSITTVDSSGEDEG